MSVFAHPADLRPPVARVQPQKLEKHGDVRVDPYYWLRDRSNPEVIRYLEAENTYTEAVMAPAKPLQEKLYKEILGRIKETDTSAPARRGPYLYYTRTEQGKQYPIYCRRPRTSDREEILVDANELAKGHAYFKVGVFMPSPDHTLLAWSTNVTGDEQYTLVVKDLKTGTMLPDRVEHTYYDVEWANDNKTLFYTVLDQAKRPWRVYRHVLGTDAADPLIYEETDERFHTTLGKTLSQKFLLIQLESSVTSEVRYLPASDPTGQFRVLAPREQDHEYDVTEREGEFWIRTNAGAKNFRLVKAPVGDPSQKNWREVIAHRADVKIEHVEAFASHLVITEREKGLRRLRIRRLPGNTEHYIEFPEPAYVVRAVQNYEYTTAILRFSYNSLVTPPSEYDYDMDRRTRELVKREEVLGGYDPGNYESERIFATAKDGTKLPIALVYRKGFRRDGSGPALLYGYGSYGSTTDATFSSARISLLDRGFIYAIATIRGGSEMGEAWHDSGKMLNKVNTFTDFVAAAEHLVGQKYTSRERLAIMGGSAGGLLIGAVLNMRPELFRTAVAKVPFVDVVTTILDPSLPLTVIEYEEWGNPNQKKYYEYMKSYSPYDNVKPQAYPNILITAGLNDPRVSYWEPAKWAARLRAMKTDNSVLLLKTEMGAGHFGVSGRYEKIKETAFDYSFILWTLGIRE
ncbi:MAG TPA: S9 family peptidase [Bryobacteraceae bacterium]|nr:S9 family peptidase [Bryobacteraceae bacterium]